MVVHSVTIFILQPTIQYGATQRKSLQTKGVQKEEDLKSLDENPFPQKNNWVGKNCC